MDFSVPFSVFHPEISLNHPVTGAKFCEPLLY